MDIHSWDYVDPILATRFITLSSSISKIKKEIKALQESRVVRESVKQSLKKKKEAELMGLEKEYQEYKLGMIEYYDRQTNILNKEMIAPRELSLMEKTSSLIDRTKVNYEINESTIENSKIAENLQSIHDIREQERKRKRRGGRNGRVIKNLRMVVKHQKKIIKRFICNQTDDIRQQEIDIQQQQKVIKDRTIEYYKEKNQQNEQLIKQLRTKIQLIQTYYQNREQQINKYWTNLVNKNNNHKNIPQNKPITKPK